MLVSGGETDIKLVLDWAEILGDGCQGFSMSDLPYGSFLLFR